MTGCSCHSGCEPRPRVLPDADQVRIDRAEIRHAAFGLGIHCCIGSKLARMELRVALEEWIRLYPAFELTDSAQVICSAGQVRGPRLRPHPDPAGATSDNDG